MNEREGEIRRNILQAYFVQSIPSPSQTQLQNSRRKRRNEKKNVASQIVPTVTHFRSWISSFLKTESIPAFMKTTFHSSSASTQIHPCWPCAEPEKEATEQLCSGTWRECQGEAREGAFRRGRSWRDLLFSSGGASTINNSRPTSF